MTAEASKDYFVVLLINKLLDINLVMQSFSELYNHFMWY